VQGNLLGIAAGLTDDELLRRVRDLAGREREATVELVAHLAEVDTRKLYLSQGYGSLFSYCTESLRLAEHAAYNRIEAARASRRFPRILDRLADGSLNLSTVRLLAPHLTSETHEKLLDQAAGKTKRAVEALVARLAPRPDVPASVRRLPSPLAAVAAAVPASAVTPTSHAVPTSPTVLSSPATSASHVTPASRATPASPGTPVSAPDPVRFGDFAEAGIDAWHLCDPPAPHQVQGSGPSAALSTRPLKRVVIAPLAPERYRVQFTVGSETYQNLRRVQDLLRREVPDGDPRTIFDRALKLLLADIARKKLAATSKPRPGRPTADRSRHVPAHIKRAVWLRDGGQCAFVAPSGRRCRERAILEFHHVAPYAIGGETTSHNLSLRCRAHNAHESERLFGPFVPVVRAGVRHAGGRDGTATRPGASP